jgi:ubiquinone/menaquinone biosynthesis C-methylase UbiE
MTDSAANTDQIAYWNETAGQTWAELQDLLDVQLEPMGAATLDALALRPGDRVIDIGCGCGQTTLALADRVGAEGLAVGADISEPMLAVARGRAAGRLQVRFLEADAQTYPFEPRAFDALHSRFGVMFFEDPTAAFVKLRKALKPGGRLAFLCWRTPAENPVMTAPMMAAQAHLPPPEPMTPGAPGPFAFADPERVRRILTDAGFADIAIQPQDMPAGGNSLDETLALSLRIGPLGRMLREHPEVDRDAAVADVRKVLAAHLDANGKVFMGSGTWIVTARNP